MSAFVRFPLIHPALRLLPLLSVLALGGCMSMSGLGGDSKYACKAPEGVACESVSGTYANAVANNLPSQRKRESPAAPRKPETATPRTSVSTRTGLTAAGSSSPPEDGTPLRAQSRYLRLWIKPWEDIDGDLYDQAHVYVQIDQGRWLIDHVQQRIRDANAPLRPPPSTSAPSNATEATTSPAQPAGRPILPAPARLLNNSGEVSQ
jgi:conjugal transfer pilus assembly protein TraV